MIKVKCIDSVWIVTFNGQIVGTGYTCESAIKRMLELSNSLGVKLC